MNAHPNAAAALITGLGTTGLLWLLARAGLDLPEAAAAGIVTGMSTAVLVVGRDAWSVLRKGGVAGLWRLILHGEGRRH